MVTWPRFRSYRDDVSRVRRTLNLRYLARMTARLRVYLKLNSASSQRSKRLIR
jgi:hypothetical protein